MHPAARPRPGQRSRGAGGTLRDGSPARLRCGSTRRRARSCRALQLHSRNTDEAEPASHSAWGRAAPMGLLMGRAAPWPPQPRATAHPAPCCSPPCPTQPHARRSSRHTGLGARPCLLTPHVWGAESGCHISPRSLETSPAPTRPRQGLWGPARVPNTATDESHQPGQATTAHPEPAHLQLHNAHPAGSQGLRPAGTWRKAQVQGNSPAPLQPHAASWPHGAGCSQPLQGGHRSAPAAGHSLCGPGGAGAALHGGHQAVNGSWEGSRAGAGATAAPASSHTAACKTSVADGEIAAPPAPRSPQPPRGAEPRC